MVMVHQLILRFWRKFQLWSPLSLKKVVLQHGCLCMHSYIGNSFINFDQIYSTVSSRHLDAREGDLETFFNHLRFEETPKHAVTFLVKNTALTIFIQFGLK